MGNPIDKFIFDSYKYIYQDPNVRISHNPLAASQKPFNINAPEGINKANKDLKKGKNKKKDKNGKETDEDDDDNDKEKPLPRPMGL